MTSVEFLSELVEMQPSFERQATTLAYKKVEETYNLLCNRDSELMKKMRVPKSNDTWNEITTMNRMKADLSEDDKISLHDIVGCFPLWGIILRAVRVAIFWDVSSGIVERWFPDGWVILSSFNCGNDQCLTNHTIPDKPFLAIWEEWKNSLFCLHETQQSILSIFKNDCELLLEKMQYLGTLTDRIVRNNRDAELLEKFQCEDEWAKFIRHLFCVAFVREREFWTKSIFVALRNFCGVFENIDPFLIDVIDGGKCKGRAKKKSKDDIRKLVSTKARAIFEEILIDFYHTDHPLFRCTLAEEEIPTVNSFDEIGRFFEVQYLT